MSQYKRPFVSKTKGCAKIAQPFAEYCLENQSFINYLLRIAAY